jgi:hypothetical protein
MTRIVSAVAGGAALSMVNGPQPPLPEVRLHRPVRYRATRCRPLCR